MVKICFGKKTIKIIQKTLWLWCIWFSENTFAEQVGYIRHSNYLNCQLGTSSLVLRKHNTAHPACFKITRCGTQNWIKRDNFQIIGPHDDVIKWQHFRVTGHLCGEFTGPRRDSPHKGQWRGTLMFSSICAWINRWVNNGEAGDLRRYRTHYDVIVMWYWWHIDALKNPDHHVLRQDIIRTNEDLYYLSQWWIVISGNITNAFE